MADTPDLWSLANDCRDEFIFSTLFTAQDVRDRLADAGTLGEAVAWCRRTGVTRVFIESFREGYLVEKETLERARDTFRASGIEVSGCVTTLGVGKRQVKEGDSWSVRIGCYTNAATRARLREIFQFTASIFDLVMIDDFLFTECVCVECDTARGERSWSEYRCDVMMEASNDSILAGARSADPPARVIIKYPQWYDTFHQRGYDVLRQTRAYDLIWVGTETRDYDDAKWGGTTQYEAYFIMRWLSAVGGAKTGGGWFDPYGTTPATYVEQARQTILGGAKEAVLFCYGSLVRGGGPANVARLRAEMPLLFELASLVRTRTPRGVLAVKPPGSEAGDEAYVFDFVGMLGVPLVPATGIVPAEAAFLSTHVSEEPGLGEELGRMLASGTPVLITDGLAERLKGTVGLEGSSASVLNVRGRPKSLLEMDRAALRELRAPLLKPFGAEFDAPAGVALNLLGDDAVVIQNFRDEAVDVRVRLESMPTPELRLAIPGDLEVSLEREGGGEIGALRATVGARGLIVLR